MAKYDTFLLTVLEGDRNSWRSAPTPDDMTVRFFCVSSVVAAWLKDLKHVTGPVEAYAVWPQLGSFGISTLLDGIVLHVDNYGPMDAFVKGLSTSKHIRDIPLEFERCEATHPTWPWFSVPSAGNCADDPSRGVLDKFVGDIFFERALPLPLDPSFP